MNHYTTEELDAARAGYCYYRFLYDGMNRRKLCREPQAVKTGRGAIVFDLDAYRAERNRNTNKD